MSEERTVNDYYRRYFHGVCAGLRWAESIAEKRDNKIRFKLRDAKELMEHTVETMERVFGSEETTPEAESDS